MSVSLSSYRLGDLVLMQLKNCEKEELLQDYPDSIGSAYINRTKEVNMNLNMSQKIDLITKIAFIHMEKYKDLYPSNIENSIVIHLRLGDVMCGKYYYEMNRRPLPVYQLQNLLSTNKRGDGDPVYVIGKPFFGKPSSPNYEESVVESEKYLQNVLETLNAMHYDGGSADVDLCCAIKSKLFVQGKGYFSKLIVEIRRKLGKRSIETIVHN